jgi:signal transduction histidine kinase
MAEIVYPPNEAERLQALYEYHILDTPPEDDFDELVNLISEICETPIAHIALLDKDRQWLKSRKGLKSNQMYRGIAFCQYTILEDNIMEIPDAYEDNRFINNPLVTDEPNIRFYAGISLKNPGGFNVGTLCVIDTVPRSLTTFQKNALDVISKQVMAQMELRKKNKELLELVKQTNEYNVYQEKLSLLQSRMLSIVSHDLRNPITSLKGLVLLLQNGSISHEELLSLGDMLNIALSSVEELLVNLIDWARKQFENQSDSFEDVSITTLLDEIIQLVSFSSQQKNIQIINNTYHSEVWADKEMLRFILRNLISNAIKYTLNGTITVATEEKDTQIEISIVDTGTGMSGKRLEKLFDWDSRQSKPGTEGEKGTGLGLLLCQDFARKMNSTIYVESKEGQGSRFYFTLPKAVNKKEGSLKATLFQ